MELIKIKIFGYLSDYIDNSCIAIKFPSTLKEFDEYLKNKYPILRNVTYSYAINKKLVTDINNDIIINVDDEIGLLPPFSGG